MIKVMIKAVFLLSCLVYSGLCFSQNNKSKASHYVLPQFTEGIVLMKDGTKKVGLMNYNALSENFAIKDGETISAFPKSEQSMVDTVYIANRKFIRKDKLFLELLLHSKTLLFLEHGCNLQSSTAASSGYGGTSQTTSAVSIGAFESEGNLYALELPDLYTVKPFKKYWLIKGGNQTTFKALSQLKKVYKQQKKEFNALRKQYKTDVKKPQDVVTLIKLLEKVE